MKLPMSPDEFVNDMFSLAKQSLEAHNEVHSVIFLPTSNGNMLAIPVDSFMENEDGKNIISLLPAYFGMLQGGLPLYGLLTEAWTTRFEKDDVADNEDAFNERLQAAYKKCGSVSNMPGGIKKEVVMLTVSTEEGDDLLVWDIKRDLEQQGHIIDNGAKFQPNIESKSAGRFAETRRVYFSLNGMLDKMHESLKLPKHSLLSQLSSTMEKMTQMPHVAAFKMAERISENIANKNGDITLH
jgi:hypothetical protein